MSLDQFISAVASTIINPFIFLLFAVALLYFVWGIFMYIRNAESGDKGTHKDAILWGLVGMFIMIGVYGIWNVVLKTFDISNKPLESIKQR